MAETVTASERARSQADQLRDIAACGGEMVRLWIPVDTRPTARQKSDDEVYHQSRKAFSDALDALAIEDLIARAS